LPGVALLKVFGVATALLLVSVRLAGMFHFHFMWLAAWMFFVLMGTLVTLGFPRIREWQLLTDDRL
jgi:hypothetical protein